MSDKPDSLTPARSDGRSHGWVIALALLIVVMAGLWAYCLSGQGSGDLVPPPPATPDFPARGIWKMPANQRELTIIYRGTPSAEGRLAVRLDVKEGTFVIENLLDKRIAIAPFYRLTYTDGRVESLGQAVDVAVMEPKQKTSGRLDAFADSGFAVVEFWYLVTP